MYRSVVSYQPGVSGTLALTRVSESRGEKCTSQLIGAEPDKQPWLLQSFDLEMNAGDPFSTEDKSLMLVVSVLVYIVFH